MIDNPDEVFTIVDEYDTVISYRSRFDCHHDKSLMHRAIGVIVFNDKGEILLQKRSLTKDTSPGLWTLSASGHVDLGESYEEAAIRETKEELGVSLSVTFCMKFICRSSFETEMDAVFTASHNGPFTTNREETDTVAFFNTKQIQSMKNELTEFARQTLRNLKIIT